MRLLSRIHLCVAVATFGFLYFVWQRRSSLPQVNIPAAWRRDSYRIVVFGDDWSDTGKSWGSAFSHLYKHSRDPDQGRSWVETMCEELRCISVDNLAHSIPRNQDVASVGAVIDAGIHTQAIAKSGGGASVSDFKTQIQQYLELKRQGSYIPVRFRNPHHQIIFTIWFGLWDILEYSKLDQGMAMLAIELSIKSLFGSLKDLVHESKNSVKIVLPRMVDVTFLPHFQATKNLLQDHFAEEQHRLVFLWQYWNSLLAGNASEWKDCEVFMPSPNSVIMGKVRADRELAEKFSESPDTEKQAPSAEPCVRLFSSNEMSNMQLSAVEKCSEPTNHLFWDDINFGAVINRQIGLHAATHVRYNATVNSEKEMQGPDGMLKLPQGESGSFNLLFPPGY